MNGVTYNQRVDTKGGGRLRRCRNGQDADGGLFGELRFLWDVR